MRNFLLLFFWDFKIKKKNQNYCKGFKSNSVCLDREKRSKKKARKKIEWVVSQINFVFFVEIFGGKNFLG